MLSPKSARKAGELGYTNIKVYHDGLPVWKKNKNAVYSTVKGLSTFNEKQIPYVLLDARADAERAGGVIAGAVAAAAADLEGMKGEFPKSKKAPVIIYGGADAEAVFAMVRGWGYKNASILKGGVGSWTAAGNALADKTAEKIVYVPKPRPGEFPVADFDKAAAGEGNVLILDVRGADETSQGMISGALNIPLPELGDRLAEFPADRKIVAQCNTGAQAEMAYNLLKEHGIDAGWLNAKVTIGKDGSYTIGD